MSAAEQHARWHLLDWKVKGIIYGMEEMGARFDEVRPPFIYFTIPKGSRLHGDKEALKRGYEGCLGVTGLRMKVRHE